MSSSKENTRLAQEFLEGIKHFYNFKTKVLSKYAIKSMADFKKLQNQILEINTIKELGEMRIKLFKLGMGSIKNFRIIEIFYSYLMQNINNINISQLKFLKIEEIVDFLYEKSLVNKSSTLMLYRVILGDFFRFLDKRRGYRFDFSLKGMSFNKEKVLPKFLPKPKFLNFIEYLQTHTFKRDHDKKNRLILLLISFSGMRSQEVRNLKISDFKITYDDNYQEYYSIKIIGKGNKQRLIGIKKELIEKHLLEWLECALKKRKYNSDYLFFNPLQAGSNTSRYFLIKTLKEMKFIKDDETMGLHMLRHSFASYIYDETKDIILTQNLLGHSSIETTKIYVHNTTDFSKQVINLF